jgi:hypothetical protein
VQKGRTVASTAFVLMDEFHVTIYVPRGIPPPEGATIRQALDEPAFATDLRRAVRAVSRRRPALDKVRVSVTR